MLSELATLPTTGRARARRLPAHHRSGVLEQLGELLRHPIPALRLVLLTRADPPLPLHRLRVAEDLAEIRPRDLAFTDDEAAALLAAHAMPVAAADASSLVDADRGVARRPAPRRALPASAGSGTQRAGLRRRRPGGGDVPRRGGPGQPARRDQEFLLRTSVVERVSAEPRGGPHRAGALPAAARGPRGVERLRHRPGCRTGTGSATTRCSGRCSSTGCGWWHPSSCPSSTAGRRLVRRARRAAGGVAARRGRRGLAVAG